MTLEPKELTKVREILLSSVNDYWDCFKPRNFTLIDTYEDEKVSYYGVCLENILNDYCITLKYDQSTETLEFEWGEDNWFKIDEIFLCFYSHEIYLAEEAKKLGVNET